MALADVIPKALGSLAKLKASNALNEANTKAHVIEPMLTALGWDLLDIDAVVREVKVFDGTFLDYALRLEGAPRVYVEAKSAAESLDDKKFIAQAVNYANNDGVLWCVLTNGVRWAVYKTNEPVAMDQKLLFEVDIADQTEPMSEKAQLLRLVSHAAVAAGDLDNFGERVFTDSRVRAALEQLAADGDEAVLNAIEKRLGKPAVPRDAIGKSLARILDYKLPVAEPSVTKTPVGPPLPPKGQEHTLDHHLATKSTLMRELFEELDKYAFTLGPDVARRIRKQYIGYFRGKRSFFTVEIQQRRLIVYLSLHPPTVHPWNEKAMRDVTGIGHFGMGDLEYSLRAVEQVNEVRELVKSAYDKGSAT